MALVPDDFDNAADLHDSEGAIPISSYIPV